MNIFKKISGIIGNTFQFDKGSGPVLKNSSGVVEYRNADDTAYVNIRVKEIQSSHTINDVMPLIDGQSKIIEFSFAGNSAPIAGTHTGKYGFCHTTGSGHTVSDIVYDSGASLIKITRECCTVIYTTTAITGTISLIANGTYIWIASAYQLSEPTKITVGTTPPVAPATNDLWIDTN